MREFTRDNPEKATDVREFQRDVDRRFAFGGTRQIAREERLEAGFTEEEVDELARIEREGPRRETLQRAAELVRDRHQARMRGEDIAPL